MDNYGVNFKRRKRQANENAREVLERLDGDISERKPIIDDEFTVKDIATMQFKVKYYSDKADALGKKIQADWAIPILIETISRMYMEDLKDYVDYGNAYKRALGHIWKSNFPNYNGTKKNIDSLVELLKLCYMIEMINGEGPIFIVQKEFKYKVEKGYVLYDKRFIDTHLLFKMKIAGRGKRLRVAETNNRLLHEQTFLTSIMKVLEGSNPSDIELFKGTFYEKIPGVNNSECLEFWQTVFARSILYCFSVMSEVSDEESSNVIIFHEFAMELPEGISSQNVVNNLFWQENWLKKQDVSRYGNIVVERPILRISLGGDFATSSFLIGDSINHYIEDSILGYSDRYDRAKLPDEVFKNAISEPFEEEIINEMIGLGFTAGHVSEGGIWKCRWRDEENQIINGNIDLRFDEKTKLYGEVDVLAFFEETNLAFLVECKVLNDYRSLKGYRNLVNKLRDDSEGFRKKIDTKAKWLKKALEVKYECDVQIFKVLLTDIMLPVEDNEEDDILMCDKDTLLDVLGEVLNEFC